MPEDENFYTPERVDEQVDELFKARNMLSRDQRLASDLQSILEQTNADASSLQRVLQKLMRDEPAAQETIISLADRHSQRQERFAPMDKPFKQSIPVKPATRVLSTLVAALVIVFIVGSLIVVLNASHQKPAGSSTASPKTTSQTPAQHQGQVVFRSKASSDYLYEPVWSPDGSRIAIITWSKNNIYKVQSWDAFTGKHILTYFVGSYAGQAAWSPDGTRLTVVGATKVYVYDATTTHLLRTFPAPSVALSTSSAPSLGTTQQRMASLSSINTLSGGNYRGFLNASWSPDSKYLAAESISDRKNVVSVWDANTGSVLKTLTNFGSTTTGDGFADVRWSPTGRALAIVAGKQPGTQILDTTTWQVVKQFPTSIVDWSSTFMIDWSPDGKQLALIEAGDRNTSHALIVDAQSGQTIKRLADIKDLYINGVHWSPDGTRLALEVQNRGLSEASGIEIWSVTSGTLLYRFTQSPRFGISWSPDSKYISAVVDDAKDASKVELVIWKA